MHRLRCSTSRQTLLATAMLGWWFSQTPLPAQGVARTFSPTGISGGGQLMTASVNPENPSQYFIVCDMGGLYRSNTRGLSWRLMPSDAFMTTPQTCIQFAGPATSQRLYGIRRLRWGSNLCRPAFSPDGGATWMDLPEPPAPSESNQYYYLAVDPASSSSETQRLVVDNYRKLWFSNAGGARGSWTLIHEHTGSSPDSIRMAGTFWNGSTIYVGTNAGLFLSTDGGAKWRGISSFKGLPSGAQIVELRGARHPSAGVVTLFAICVDGDKPVEGWNDLWDIDDDDPEDDGQSGDGDLDYLGLYTLTLSGSPSWTRRNGPNGETFVRIDVPAGDSTRPWAATARELNAPGIFKSMDGGISWFNTFKTGDSGHSANANVSTGYQGDHGVLTWQWSLPGLSLDVSDRDPDRVVVTADHPHLTDDGGASWRQVYVSPETQNSAGSAITQPKWYRHTGLGVTTGHWMHWMDERTIFCASTDIGLQQSNDGGDSWTTDGTHLNQIRQLDPPNWNCIVQKPGSSRLYAAVSQINDFYEPSRLDDWDGPNRFGDIYCSDDRGLTWASLSASSSGLPDSKFPGAVVELAIDPNYPSHLYAATLDFDNGGIYRSTDDGAHWTKLAVPPRTEGHPLSIRILGDNELVVTYCARVSGRGSDGADMFTPSSGVFYSDDGGASWSDRTGKGMNYFTRDLSVDPANKQQWYAAVQGTRTNNAPDHPGYDGRGGVYRTTDAGEHWTRIWRSDQVVSVTYVDGPAPLLYVTTADDGLWCSSNPSAAKPEFAKIREFPFARARRVFVDPFRTDGTIWITTQGGGLWRGTTQ